MSSFEVVVTEAIDVRELLRFRFLFTLTSLTNFCCCCCIENFQNTSMLNVSIFHIFKKMTACMLAFCMFYLHVQLRKVANVLQKLDESLSPTTGNNSINQSGGSLRLKTFLKTRPPVPGTNY